MEVKEIIENFKYNKDGKFQRESILEARKNKKEVTEELLKELEKIANNMNKYIEDEENMLLLYTLYLLAEFREKRAFPIIVKIITNDNQEKVENLLGDIITEGLKSILASTFNGDKESLYKIIVNVELDEYIRSAAFSALDILQKYNIIEKQEFIDNIEKMLNKELKTDETYVIIKIITFFAENKLYDKIEIVKKLYKEHRVDEFAIGGYDAFIDKIYGDSEPLEENLMIKDTIESLSYWACFEQDKNEVDLAKSLKDIYEYGNKKTQKEIKEVKEIGRNDLCYCGSGKKYKKCCMNKKEIQSITPADLYIEKSLKKYPKENLKNFYDDETIEIDEKIYSVLKHKSIPIWVDRNYTVEEKRNEKNMKEAIELLRAKCKKENIKTMQDFDEKLAIHYSLDKIIMGYFKELENIKKTYSEYEQIVNKKAEFLLEMTKIFNIDKQKQKKYLLYITDCFDMYGWDFDRKKAMEKLIADFPEMKEELETERFRLCEEDYEDF